MEKKCDHSQKKARGHWNDSYVITWCCYYCSVMFDFDPLQSPREGSTHAARFISVRQAPSFSGRTKQFLCHKTRRQRNLFFSREFSFIFFVFFPERTSLGCCKNTVASESEIGHLNWWNRKQGQSCEKWLLGKRSWSWPKMVAIVAHFVSPATHTVTDIRV